MAENKTMNQTHEKVLEAVSGHGLSDKQRAFVLEYIASGFNATKAAKAAGYSDRTADRQGSRLLKNVEISAAVRDALKAASIRAEALIERLTAIAMEADLTDYWGVITGKASLPKLRALGVDTRLIRSLRPVLDKEGNIVANVVTLHDPTRAAAALLKQVGGPQEAETIAEEEPPGYEPPSETYKRIILEHLGKPSVPGLPPLMPLGVLREVAMMLDEERAEQLVEDLHAGRLDGPEEQEQPPVEQAGTPAEEDEPGPVEPPVGELSVGLEDNATMPRTRPGPAIPTTRTLPPSSSFWRS